MKSIIHLMLVAALFTACGTKAENPVNNSSTRVDTISQNPDGQTTERPATKIDPTVEKNRAMALRFYVEVVNAHNIAIIDSYVTEDYVEHQYDTHFKGDKKGTIKAFEHYFTAFPDMKVRVNFVMAEKDLVTSQITITGTNTGTIYGRKPTNKKIEINGVDIVRYKDGKAVEHWGYAEEGKMLNQLGLIPSMVREGRMEQKEAAKQKKSKESSSL